MHKPTHLPRWIVVLSLVGLLLAACGGGGGNPGTCMGSPQVCNPSSSNGSSNSGPVIVPTPAPVTDTGGTGGANIQLPLPPSSTLENICTLDGEKRFVRAYMDETYLWYNEIPTVNAASYSTIGAYFKALLVTTPDSTGLPKDRFSFSVTDTDADSFSTGLNIGYGILFTSDSAGVLRVAQVTPGSPAAQANMARGGVIGRALDFNVNSWYPNTAGAFVRFEYRDTPNSAIRQITLFARTVQDDPVPQVGSVTSPKGKSVGYLLFNDHAEGAQDKLIAAVQTLKNGNATDLVLDLRYNSGGFLYIAQTLASMLAPQAATGQVFEALQFSDKRQADTRDNTYHFETQVRYQEVTYAPGFSLPRLNLPRLYVLTSEDTCSASEALVNGLRGVNVDVVLIGARTCGKPYGFTRKSNCGTSFFPIEFQGVNAKGTGDYTNGFAATCAAVDDLDRPLGQANEGQLASALHHLDNGVCAPAPAQARARLSSGQSLASMVTQSAPRARGKLIRTGKTAP